MSTFTRLQKYSILGLGISSGIAFYLYNNNKKIQTPVAFNSWTTNYSPDTKWDSNWDHRDPKSLVKPLKSTTSLSPEAENEYNKKLAAVTPKAVRHIILVRHGQYNVTGATDNERYLTETGRKQAASTGERLKSLNIPWTEMVWSTMKRAQETGKIISSSLNDVKITNCSLLEEGAPIPPEPPIGHWKPETYQFFQDGARIEAAFRKYFHRADAKQENDSFTLLVCHANVIRYFVCRALQVPAEAWLRIRLNHASLTWICIMPSGRVSLCSLGDSGHMPVDLISFK